MTIYTSYYAKYRGDRGVQISTSKPVNYTHCYRDIKELIPDRKMVRDYKAGLVTEKVYTDKYSAQLKENEEAILAALKEGDVLLCYCGPDKFCHRHIVAVWLHERGIEVWEL